MMDYNEVLDYKQCARPDGTVYGIPDSSDCGSGRKEVKSKRSGGLLGSDHENISVVRTNAKNDVYTDKTSAWVKKLDKKQSTELLQRINKERAGVGTEQRQKIYKRFIEETYDHLSKIYKAEGKTPPTITSLISGKNMKQYDVKNNFAESELGEDIPTYAESKKDMPCNKPKASSSGNSSHVVKACGKGLPEDGKLIRFGQKGVTTAGKPKEGESDKQKARRKSFKARHAKNIAKGPSSAAYWADKVKWCEAFDPLTFAEDEPMIDPRPDPEVEEGPTQEDMEEKFKDLLRLQNRIVGLKAELAGHTNMAERRRVAKKLCRNIGRMEKLL